MTDLALMAQVISERCGIALLRSKLPPEYWYALNTVNMPGISLFAHGLKIYDPRLDVRAWVKEFSWEELDEAVHHFLKIKRAL